MSLKIKCVVTCAQCHHPVIGWLSLNQKLRVQDTGGFLFAGFSEVRPVCLACVRKRDNPEAKLPETVQVEVTPAAVVKKTRRKKKGGKVT